MPPKAESGYQILGGGEAVATALSLKSGVEKCLVTARIPRYAYRALENDGYRFLRSPYSYQIASVHAIGFDERGEPSGGADIPYGDGMALAV